MKGILVAFFLCLSLYVTGQEIQSWSTPPVTISSQGIDSSNPCIAMDESGNTVALWLEGDLVVSKTCLLNSTWSTAYTLSGSGASSASLVVDPAGNATAIWIEGGTVKTATKPFGDIWGSPVTLSGLNSSSPQIAVDLSGNLVAVWVTDGVIQSATRLFGGSWSTTPDTLSSTGSDSPQVAIGANGTVVVVWHTINAVNSVNNINSATKTINGSWSAASTASNPAIDSVFPQVAVDSNGNAIAIWFTFIKSGQNYVDVVLQAARLPLNSFWSTPTNVSDAGTRNPSQLMSKIGFSNQGAAIAVWTNTTSESTYSLNSAQTLDQLNWDPPITITQDLYVYAGDIAINSDTSVLGICMTSNGGTDTTINAIESYVNAVNGNFWSSPVILSQALENGYPKIASIIGGDGNCYAATAWVNFNGVNNVIQSSVGTGQPILPPSNLVISQDFTDFGVFKEYYNTLTWDPSTDPNVFDYVIFRNGVHVDTVYLTQLSYVDHNQQEQEPVTYSICGMDNTGAIGPTITASFP